MKAKHVPKEFHLTIEVINAIPYGIALLDTKLCIVAINRSFEAMPGYSFGKVKGIYGDYILRTNLGNNDQACRMVLEKGQPVCMEGNVINRGRKIIPIHFTISRLHTLRKLPAGILVVMEDISLEKIIEHEFMKRMGRR
jgi:PAS domain S-box-containing protein